MPIGNEAMQALNKQQDSSNSLLAQERTEMQPALANINQTMSQPLPPPPKLPEIKPPPANTIPQDSQTWVMAISSLAALTGARQGATAALNAFGSGIKGLNEGNKAAFEESHKKWKENTELALDNAKLAQQEYKEILDNRKLTVQEQFQEIKDIAASYHDAIMMQATDKKDMVLVAKIIESQQAAAQRADIAYKTLDLKIQQMMDKKTPTWDEDAINAAAQAVAKGVPLAQVVPGFGKDNPNRDAVMKRAVEINPKLDLASAKLDYMGKASEERTIGGMKARAEAGGNILEKSLPSLLSAADKLGLGRSTDINSLYNTAKKHLSDQDFTNFSAQVRAVASDYALLIGRGRQTVHSDEEALRILNENMGPGGLQGFADAAKIETANVRAGFKETQDEITGDGSAPSGNKEIHWDDLK